MLSKTQQQHGSGYIHVNWFNELLYLDSSLHSKQYHREANSGKGPSLVTSRCYLLIHEAQVSKNPSDLVNVMRYLSLIQLQAKNRLLTCPAQAFINSGDTFIGLSLLLCGRYSQPVKNSALVCCKPSKDRTHFNHFCSHVEIDIYYYQKEALNIQVK